MTGQKYGCYRQRAQGGLGVSLGVRWQKAPDHSTLKVTGLKQLKPMKGAHSVSGLQLPIGAATVSRQWRSGELSLWFRAYSY
jgi:hypothetical protein